MELGRIASIELNHKGVDTARRGDSVALKLEAMSAAESSRSYGRHFDHKAWHDSAESCPVPCHTPASAAEALTRYPMYWIPSTSEIP